MENPLWVSSCLLLAGARPLAWAPDAALSHPWLRRGETRERLAWHYSLHSAKCSVFTYTIQTLEWKELHIPGNRLCVSPHIWVLQTLHTAYPSAWAWYWLRHALSGSRRPDTGTDVFSDNTTTEREQQKWENLREDNHMYSVYFFLPAVLSFPEWPAVQDMDWI